MQIQHHTIAAAHYIGAILQGATRHGQQTLPLLTTAGLAPTILQQPQARIPPQQYAQLVKAVWRALDDEFLGLTPQPCRLGTFALMTELVIHAKTLGEALQQSARFYHVVTQQISMGLTQEGSQAQFWINRLDARFDTDHFLLEFLLLSWSRLASWLVGKRIRLQAACFDYPAPPHQNEYHHLFPCPILFNQPCTCLVFDAQYLNLAIERNEAELQGLLKKLPGEFFIKPMFHGSYTHRVRQLIAEQMTTGFPCLDEVARHFWMTERTLRRKLEQEGSSYQHIKDNIRREQAVQLLVQPNQSLQQIAVRLGFAETSAFIRAFKLWTGVTPKQYLAQQTEAANRQYF